MFVTTKMRQKVCMIFFRNCAYMHFHFQDPLTRRTQKSTHSSSSQDDIPDSLEDLSHRSMEMTGGSGSASGSAIELDNARFEFPNRI